MNLIGRAALELMTSFWVLQSAAALIKTRKARRLFIDHQRWIDGGAKLHETQRVALVIAVKGVSENFDRFLDFALGQDYPDYHVLFVTESENDPAHVAIRGCLRDGDRLIVAGKAEYTGQKVPQNLDGSINDDARISQLARQAGKRMRYVRSVAARWPLSRRWISTGRRCLNSGPTPLMISHQDPGMNPPAMTGAHLSQPVDKGLPVVIGFENFLSSVATGHHMVNCAGILESRGSRHACSYSKLDQASMIFYQSPAPVSPHHSLV